MLNFQCDRKLFLDVEKTLKTALIILIMLELNMIKTREKCKNHNRFVRFKENDTVIL